MIPLPIDIERDPWVIDIKKLRNIGVSVRIHRPF